jgi:hypothetical protein
MVCKDTVTLDLVLGFACVSAALGILPSTCATMYVSHSRRFSEVNMITQNNYAIQPSCSYLANYAADIIYDCGQNLNKGNAETAGQYVENCS